MEEGRRSWEEMERDCLVHIFRLLPLDDLTAAVPFVCRRWLGASLDPLCWRNLDFRQLDLMPWSGFCRRLTSAASSSLPRRPTFSGLLKLAVARGGSAATRLFFPPAFGASFRDLLYASDKCSRLKVVVLPNLPAAEEARLAEIVGKWGELETLEMEWKPPPPRFAEMAERIGAKCRNFCGLRMVGSIKEEDVSAIVDHLPGIKHLNLSRSYLPKEQLLGILKGCRELESLSARDCIGFEADEEVRRKASGIRAFDFEGSKLFDGSGYETDECDPFYVSAIG